MSANAPRSPQENGVDQITNGVSQMNAQDDNLDASSDITLRAVISSKEAGVVIGKAGQNVADLREKTGVRAGVSKVVQGVHDRILTVSGPLDAVASAYGLVADGLLKGAPTIGMGGIVSNPNSQPIRLLISHNQMGTVIGRQGSRIKQIQDAAGVRMVAQKDMLPQSTERIVEVQGSPTGIEAAVRDICKCLLEDAARGVGTVLYTPGSRTSYTNGSSGYGGPDRRPIQRTGNGADFVNSSPRDATPRDQIHSPRSQGDNRSPDGAQNGEDIQTQNISIPADMVGCIIGRGGSKISEIRKSSGARISIAKAPHDESGERMFTITGGPLANEKALYLLYENLEAEKTRRSTLSPHEGA